MPAGSEPAPAIAPSKLARALAVFVHGFAFTRSFTHPYVPERVGPLWVMRDAPRKRGEYRVEEWVAHGVTPEEVDRLVRAQSRGRFRLCALSAAGEDEATLRAAYKGLGYRLTGTEPFMIHPLEPLPSFASLAAVKRVTTAAQADRLAKAAGSRQLLAEHLDDLDLGAALRQYTAELDGELVGWARSVRVDGGQWCSNLFVRPERRRQGIASALMCRMLADDAAAGAPQSVLTASKAGATLYPRLGYQLLGTLFIYSPVRAR